MWVTNSVYCHCCGGYQNEQLCGKGDNDVNNRTSSAEDYSGIANIASTQRGEAHDSVNGSSSSGGGTLRLRKLAVDDLDKLLSSSSQDPFESNYWRTVRSNCQTVPGSEVGEWVVPRNRCRILSFPPPLGKIVAMDGPFCVVDTSANSKSMGHASANSTQQSNSEVDGSGIRVFLARDLELLPHNGGKSQILAAKRGRDGAFENFTNVFHFEPRPHKISMKMMEGPREVSKIFDGPHPYQNNMDISKRISFPGATRLLVKFHSQTVTESGCDYIKFAKVNSTDGEASYWGQPRYSGSSGASNWPGVGGSSPLEIEADSFDFKFHSDSSCTYWGWKYTVYAFYPSSSPIKDANVTDDSANRSDRLLWRRKLSMVTRSKFLPSTQHEPDALLKTLVY